MYFVWKLSVSIPTNYVGILFVSKHTYVCVPTDCVGILLISQELCMWQQRSSQRLC
jgi:hypothetical protein